MHISLADDRKPWTGYAFALGAAMCFGGSNVLAKNLIDQYAPPLAIACFSLLFGTTALLPFVGRGLGAGLRVPRVQVGMILLSGAVAAGAVTSLYFSLSRAPVVVVSPIAATNPLITLVMAHLFLQHMERVTLRLILGALLVVMGVVLVILGSVSS